MMMILQAPDQVYNSVLIHGRFRALLLLYCILLLISVCSFHYSFNFPVSLSLSLSLSHAIDLCNFPRQHIVSNVT